MQIITQILHTQTRIPIVTTSQYIMTKTYF